MKTLAILFYEHYYQQTMRIREMHLLPNQRIAYNSLDTYRRAYLILNCEHKQSFIKYNDLMKNMKNVDGFTSLEIMNYISRNDYSITNDLMIISLNLN